MNDPADQMDLTPAPPAPQSAVNDLYRDLHSVRNLLAIVIMALIILACSINVVLLRQVSLVRYQAAELTAVVANYDKNEAPTMQDFFNRLKAFGNANPDFAPVLNRLFPPAPAQTPAQTPAPAAPSTAKPTPPPAKR